jgi:hypothetical protein
MGGRAVSGGDEAGEQDPASQVVASAVSARHTMMAFVNRFGFVSSVRLLSPVVRSWDSRTFNDNTRAVARVAHDRYQASTHYPKGSTDGRVALDTAAEAERHLNF